VLSVASVVSVFQKARLKTEKPLRLDVARLTAGVSSSRRTAHRPSALRLRRDSNEMNSRSIETLRHALQRERGSFSNVHGSTPIRQLFRGWVRGGSETEGSRFNGCSNVKENKKGALRPFVCLAADCCAVSVRSRFSQDSDPAHKTQVAFLYQSALICVYCFH
jgi:hypothetical protein